MFHYVQKHLQKNKSWQVLCAVTNLYAPFKYHACSFLPDLCFNLQNYTYSQGKKGEKKIHLLPSFSQQKENSCTL